MSLLFKKEGEGEGKGRLFGTGAYLLFRPRGGGRGKKSKAMDRQSMFSQLAKRSASQRFSERAGKFFAVNSVASAARMQC